MFDTSKVAADSSVLDASRVARQHSKGKLTAGERLHVLLDGGVFNEIDSDVVHRSQHFNVPMHRGDGVIAGHGKVYGRSIFFYSQDFTILGGSLGRAHAEKICKILDLAAKTGSPVIGINDSGGARIQEGVESLAGYGSVFQRNVHYSGVIPQISVIMGPCAGGAVYSPAITDFTFMVRNTSCMFVTGPDVVRQVTHESVCMDELGGSSVHTKKSGVADLEFADDVSAMLALRKFLTFLPSNSSEFSAISSGWHSDFEELDYSLHKLVPSNKNAQYDIRDLITQVVDHGDFFELGVEFARNIVIGFCRVAGCVVGIVANQPMVSAGCLDIDASVKGARFVRFCDAFNIPILTFVDVPGFLPGTFQEHNGLIRKGAKLLYAYAEATVPKITVIIRKAYGGAYIVMGSKHLGGDFNFAWPNSEIAVMGSAGAAKIIFGKEIKKDPSAALRLTKEYEDKFMNPYQASSLGFLDEVIDSASTRAKICSAVRLMKNKKVLQTFNKKHDNLPM